MDSVEDALKVRKMVEMTLADFEVIATAGTGAILYSRRWSSTDLPRNLHAAAVATVLRLGSLDYAKRRHVPASEPLTETSANEHFIAATTFAREYMDTVRDNISDDEVPLTLGAHASRVALQRLQSGFRASDLLYRLGFNYEGDAVARQILEQIAWSLVAGEMDDIESIGRIKAQGAVSKLKKIVPSMGELYGRLSATTHAGLDQHREAFMSEEGTNPYVLLAWSRLGESARLLSLLADAWVVVWEKTQHPFMTSLVAFASPDDALPIANREFLLAAQSLITVIDDSER